MKLPFDFGIIFLASTCLPGRAHGGARRTALSHATLGARPLNRRATAKPDYITRTACVCENVCAASAYNTGGIISVATLHFSRPIGLACPSHQAAR